jgi:DNA-binding NarL/FixJ family response regulator
VRKAGKLEWRGGRLILEVDATIRVPVELDAVRVGFKHGIKLTRREQDTLGALLKGASNKEIANDLNVSVRTVKHHVSSLLRKFGVHGRGELTAAFGKDRSGNNTD